MNTEKEIIKARKSLRKIYMQYTKELHSIITKIDDALSKLQ